MKRVKLILIVFALTFFLALEGCGLVVFTTRLNNPPPPWFYPNRIETVRYVYFPDHYIYYDLSLSTYFYLDNGVWISATVLPSRYNTINLRRSRYTRINSYFGDNIGQYHRENNNTTRRRSTTNSTRRRN